MRQFFTSSGQSIGISASVSVLPMNIQNYLLYDGLVGSPCSPRDSQESSPTPQFKSISILWHSTLFRVQLSHPHMTTGKTIPLTRWTFVGKVMSLQCLCAKLLHSCLSLCDPMDYSLPGSSVHGVLQARILA